MTKRKAPGAAGTAAEGANPGGNGYTTMIADKYREYSTRVADDVSRAAFYEECDGRLARFHARIYRMPSAAEFYVRHMQGATADDRVRAEQILQKMPEGEWARFPASRWFKHRNSAGQWYWVMELGYKVGDPLIQLELEMMIDQHVSMSQLLDAPEESA